MLGKIESGAITIDREKLVGGHVGILGNTGSGKSHTIRKLLEDTFGTFQQVIFDVEDEFHTLTQAHPYDVVRAELGRNLLTQVITSRRSVVIQMNHLTVNQQCRYMAAFIDRLMELPRSYWRPMLIVIDEAHRYAPQAGGSQSLAAINGLLSRGRKRGFTAVLATQRVAKINKNALGEVTNWLIGRTGPIDRRRAAEMLGFAATSREAKSLPDLDPGQFWVFGPALSRKAVLAMIEQPVSRHLELRDHVDLPSLPLEKGRAPVWSILLIVSILGGVTAGIATGWTIVSWILVMILLLNVIPRMSRRSVFP